VNKIAWYLFALSALLIVVAYYTGSVANISAFSEGLVKIGYAFTGRTPQGQFANYPK